MKEGDSRKDERKLITTDDGSHSLFVPSLNETYHSFHGALQESRHVFINMGLSYKVEANQPKGSAPLQIFEVGFGTGLNALLAAEFAKKHNLPITFTSIEAFPLSKTLVEKLNYTSFLSYPDAEKWFTKMHQCAWNEEERIHACFTLKKVEGRLETYSFKQGTYDLIFFDAFAPSKQAELWDLKILKNIKHAMAPGAVFVTYCARGQLKRDLQSLNLQIETLSGPPGKKQMVRAIKK